MEFLILYICKYLNHPIVFNAYAVNLGLHDFVLGFRRSGHIIICLHSAFILAHL